MLVFVSLKATKARDQRRGYRFIDPAWGPFHDKPTFQRLSSQPHYFCEKKCAPKPPLLRCDLRPPLRRLLFPAQLN